MFYILSSLRNDVKACKIKLKIYNVKIYNNYPEQIFKYLISFNYKFVEADK